MKKILGWFNTLNIIGIVLLFFGFMVFGLFFGSSNSLFVWPGIGAMVIGAALIVISSMGEKAIDELSKEELKSKGLKVEVDLNQAVIDTVTVSEEVWQGERRNRYLEWQHMAKRRITIPMEYQGMKLDWQAYSDKQEEELNVLLALKGKTILYIDPQQVENNYLDLEFLD